MLTPFLLVLRSCFMFFSTRRAAGQVPDGTAPTYFTAIALPVVSLISPQAFSITVLTLAGIGT